MSAAWSRVSSNETYPTTTCLKVDDFFGCPRQINRWPCHSLSEWVSEVLISASSEHCRLQSCRRHLWPFLQLIRRMRRNVMNNKKTKTDTKTKTKTMRFSDLVTQWHTWLFLTNWGLRNSNHDIEGFYSDCQRVTLTAFAILPMFWSKYSKRTVWILANCRNSKKEGDQKKVAEAMSEIIFICEVSIRIRIKFARDVPWRVTPLSAILQPPFHYIHFHQIKIISLFL